jgi:hypothetical protein
MLGWYACIAGNAGLGCPNLVDRFILGKAVAGSGALGGSNTHTIAAAELPVHTHDLSNHTHATVMGSHSHSVPGTLFGGEAAGGYDPGSLVYNSGYGVRSTSTDLGTLTSGAPSNNFSGNGGFANSAIDMHPAYYSVVFVKRVS